jgi:hypothetical protein
MYPKGAMAKLATRSPASYGVQSRGVLKKNATRKAKDKLWQHIDKKQLTVI